MALKRGGKKKQKVVAASVFFFFCFSAELFLVLFCLGYIVAKKKKMTAFVTFFDGFATRNWQPISYFAGLVVKKVTATMSLPYSMVAVM